MATLSVRNIVLGSNVTDLAPDSAASGGDKFAPGADVWIHAANADGAATRTITVATPGNVRGLPVDDLEIVVPISGIAVRGPFYPDVFAGSDGLASMTYDDESDLTLGLWRLGQ